MSRFSRRSLLAGSTAVVYARASSVEHTTQKKLKVVATGAHPGDPEYGCGGTIARYTSLGNDVTLLYLNRGEKGCSGQSGKVCRGIRVAEGQRACQLLKARPRFLDQIDGEAVVSPGQYDDFHGVLESEKPDVVFTHWPIDNHRDHRAISMLVYDAWLQANKNFCLYYYEVSNGEDTVMFSPTDYVDITRTDAIKRAACFAHASQSPERYYALQSTVTRFRGIESGYEQAEAFISQTGNRGSLLP